MDTININDGWRRTSDHVFWGEIAPCEHVVQIYENDDVFLDLLSGFASGGLHAGDSVVVIATTAHLDALNQRLSLQGHEVADLILRGQYIPLDAEASLAKFMVHDWPDENLFNQFVNDILFNAKTNGRQVRAFGEMVAILWAKGQVGATVRLEHLWNKFCETQSFSLFCAYPQSGFTQDAKDSVMHICGAHSRMISGVAEGKTEILYRNFRKKNAV